ncbi:saccharopine dehydrogenase family protein [Kaarinaea lacus]
MANICVLGCGMVGSTICRDLATQHQVTAIDINDDNLQRLRDQNIKTLQLDVSVATSLEANIKSADLVINAVPGHLGYNTLKNIINAGKNVVDIAFFPEDALSLDSLAQKKNVTAIVDMGVAPGLGNLILGHHDSLMQITRFQCYVGGLPKLRRLPFQYKAPFSPIDVIEEYTRPARLMQDNKIVEKAALSDIELLEFEQVGTLEAFNTDGLRSLLSTMKHIPEMAEKTLRYPGHAELIKTLKSIGLFDDKKLAQSQASPLEVTTELLLHHWRLQPGEEEFTVMRIIVDGRQQEENVSIIYDLYDEYDASTETTSMARTTGYACTAAANALLSGLYTNKGVNPPELLGRQKQYFDFILTYLKQRNIEFEIFKNQS